MRHQIAVAALIGALTVALLAACAPAATPTPAPAKPPAASPPAKTSVATPAPQAAGDPAKGKAIFEANCNACHPGGGQGVGPDIRGKDPNAVKQQVRNGGKNMPAFPPSQINDEQLNDLAAYVKSLK